jgi:signal transduction histidine kinase
MDVDGAALDEMNKDLQHLMKIVERFSKIGSETELSPNSVNEVVGETVMYFRKRVPRNVTLSYNGLAMAPVKANMNVALFEWVVENLMKNSLDAMQGQGELEVHLSSSEKSVYIDVSDTGKGIAKSNWKRIFEPGFTTKTRGWGLGLSLARRIVEDYHHGKIAVAKSEVGRGTTIRITLKRIFE